MDEGESNHEREESGDEKENDNDENEEGEIRKKDYEQKEGCNDGEEKIGGEE